MNYRMLFILALLILTVGVIGLVLMPTNDENDSNIKKEEVSQPKQEEKQEIPQVEITLVKLNRDIARGELLQDSDLEISKQSVAENNPIKNKDFKTAENDSQLANAKDVQSLTNALQGFAAAKDLKAGTLIISDDVISPNDERFSFFAIDANKEVAYRLCVRAEETYSLDTLKANDIVSINAIDDQEVKDKNLTAILPTVKLLHIKKNEPDEDGKLPECYANVRLKLSLEQLKQLYEAKRLFVNRISHFLLLPAQPVKEKEEVEQRGKFIRSLRGAN